MDVCVSTRVSAVCSLEWRKLSFSFRKAMLFTPDKVTRGFYASHAWELIMLGIWSVGIPGFLGILHITQRCVTYFYIEFNSLLWELLPIYKSLAGYLEKTEEFCTNAC